MSFPWRVTGAVLLAAVILGWSVSTRAPEREKVAVEDDAFVTALEAGRVTTPVIGQDGVTFYAKAVDGTAPRIVSDVTGWGERTDGTFDFGVGKMARVANSNWYSLTAAVAPAARIEYLIAYATGDYRQDPLNPRVADRVGGPASEFVMPGYAPPEELTGPAPTETGRVAFDDYVDSRILHARRRVIVYVPASFSPRAHHPIVVFNDGALMASTGQGPRVLDALVAERKIPPVVGVFVDPASRADDYTTDAPMRDFLARELVPWLAARFGVSSAAHDHAIVGVSAGGRGALATAAKYPEVFGKIGLLIPAVGPPDVNPFLERKAPRPSQVFSVVLAKYDRLYREPALRAMTTVRSLDYELTAVEVPEGHTTATWRNHLGHVLTELFGR